MKLPIFGRYMLCCGVAAAMLVGCGGSQPPIRAPGALLKRVAGPLHAPRSGIYVSQGQSSESVVLGYPSNDRKNRGPICTESVHSTYNLAVDGRGNLIVPNPAVASDNRTIHYVMTLPAAGRRNPARGASHRATFPPQSHANLQG
jgi:hypothetical protein